MRLRQYSARVFGWLLLLLLATSPALAERRVALVIGNDAYTHLPKLNNARKDAEGMAAKLKELGFETILKVNAGRRGMARAIRDFEGRLASGAVGLAYFAGHGIQADGKNYLIPANANIEVEADLSVEALTAQDILAAMERAGNPLNILILDACRDNPLPKRSRSAKRGLTVVGIPAGAKGTAILYSAGEGQTAEDGPPGGHGVFTGELLKVMDQPGLTLEQVFKRVNRRVQQRTGSRQRPWNLVSLQGDFVFRAAKLAAQPAAQANTQPAADACAPARLAWQYVANSQRASDFQAFIQRYPSCFLADLARTRLAELKRGAQVASVAPTAPSPALEVTSLDQTMIVSGAAKLNIREIPGGSKVGGFKSGDQVEVTGETQHEGALWYRVTVAGGGAGFVFGKYLSDKPHLQLTAVKPATPDFIKPILPEGSSATRYKYAFSFLMNHDYEIAGKAFREFVDGNRDDPLAGKAMYWLGETYYVREMFAESAVTFAEGYEKYPGNPKTADNLLKLGFSLARLRRLEDACVALAQLSDEFPNASATIKRRALTEGKRIDCKNLMERAGAVAQKEASKNLGAEALRTQLEDFFIDKGDEPEAEAVRVAMEASVGTRITVSEIQAVRQQLAQCWNITAAARHADALKFWNVAAAARHADALSVEIEMVMNRDATIRQARVVDADRMNSDPNFRATAESAMRALVQPNCVPLKLPLGKYSVWRHFTFNFDPSKMLE